MKRQPKFEVYQDKDGDWRWRVIAANGRITGASSEGYRKRSDCERGAGITAQAVIASKQAPSSSAIN